LRKDFGYPSHTAVA